MNKCLNCSKDIPGQSNNYFCCLKCYGEYKFKNGAQIKLSIKEIQALILEMPFRKLKTYEKIAPSTATPETAEQIFNPKPQEKTGAVSSQTPLTFGFTPD